jgi:3'(2'), 5'-bisphosphate nucleotidase
MLSSFHNFAVDDLAQDLRVAAYNDRGVMKAIEHKKEKIFSQMWHSEREKEFNSNTIEFISDFFNFGLHEVIEIAKKAGKAVMEIYTQDFDVAYKDDNSPVTSADIKANEIIREGLQSISAYPIVSEEIPEPYDTRKNWRKFWLVDPLDGTKDFIAKNGAFTINIALIDKNEPLLGVVYLPSSGDIYYAIKDGGAFKNGIKIVNTSKRIELIGTDSNFHSTPQTQAFFEKYKIKHIERYGSSIKICKLAEGLIDVYPRLNGTKEWDTAAAHMIAIEAGCKLIDVVTKKELQYNKEDIKNNYFVACRNDLEFEI